MTNDREEAIVGLLYVLLGIVSSNAAAASTGLRILGSNMPVSPYATPVSDVLDEAEKRFTKMVGPLS